MTPRHIVCLACAILTGWGSLRAQEPQDPFVLTVDTQLVLRTVGVRDDDGNSIGGFTAEDFIVTEDGVPQAISVFEFQRMDETPRTETGVAPRTSDAVGDATSSRARTVSGRARYDDRRLLAFYFDLDSLGEFERFRALEAAQQFLTSEMRVADLVAILVYAQGQVDIVQDFTENEAALREAIAAVLNDDYISDGERQLAFGQNAGQFNLFTTDRRLMALQTAVRMLGLVGQAKSLIYFANGITLDPRNQAQLRSTLNTAVRANVSIYPIDSRGLAAFAPMGSAAERSPGGISMYTGASALGRLRGFQRSQDALYTLAADSGGRALLDSNDLVSGIVQAQRDTSSYYVIGYYPTNTARDGALRRVDIRLRDRAADLDYIDAYYAYKDFSEYTDADKERHLEDALLLEDPITDLPIALVLNYFQLNNAEYFVPLAAAIPGSELLFGQGPESDRLVIDFIGEIRDSYGTTVSNLRDEASIDLEGEMTGLLASRSIRYDTGFTVLPGDYVIKFLARNADTGRVGTYQTDFTIPNLNREELRLPISSVVVGTERVEMADALFNAGADEAARQQRTNPLVQDGQKLVPAVEAVFARDRNLHVYLEAYDRDAEPTEPIVVFATLFDGADRVFETPAFVVDDGMNPRSKAVPLRFTVSLAGLAPGEYECQVTVLDTASRKAAFWQSPVEIVP